MEAYPEAPRNLWVMNWPGQTVLAVSCTYWTTEVHHAISNSPTGLADYLVVCNGQIDKIVELVRGKLSMQTRITLGMWRVSHTNQHSSTWLLPWLMASRRRGEKE